MGSTAASPVAAAAADSAEIRLLLICQAEGLRNRYSNLAGYEQYDDNGGLTALGWEQANLLAAWLKSHEKLQVLISAPQLRSRLTAQRIGQMVGLPVQVRQEFPKFVPDSLVTPGFVGEMPRYPSELHQSPPVFDEQYQVFCQQVVSAVDWVVREQWGKTIALVMNGTAIGAMLRHFLGAQLLPIHISHASISELARREQHWSLLYINRREHLPVPPIAAANPAAAASDEKSREQEDLSRVVDLYNTLALTSVASPLNSEKNNIEKTPADKLLAEKTIADRQQRMRMLLKFAQLPTNLSILDVGTGNGQVALELSKEGASEVIGVDISPVMLEAAEYSRLARATPEAQRVSFRLAAAHSLPFSDARFDVCVCHTLLHHSQKPALILQEVARVLKPGGLLLLAELIGTDDPVKRATANAIEERRNPAHGQLRSADQLRKLVTGVGLTIENEKVVNFERELEEWLGEYLADAGNRETVRKMVEAGIEADAASLNVRSQAGRMIIEQRLLYIKAVKK